MKPENDCLKLLNHFTFLIYPFLHAVPPQEHAGQRETANIWQPWWSRLDEYAIAKALDDTYFFLPYIRAMLFPETELLKKMPPGENYCNHVKEIHQIVNSWSHYQTAMSADAVRRLTYCQTRLQSIAHFNVVQHRKLSEGQEEHSEIPASFEWIDAVLFASGLGFLIFKVKLTSKQPQLSQLIDLNYYLRLVHPPTVDWVLPMLNFEGGAENVFVRDLIDFLVQEMVGDEFTLRQQQNTWRNIWRRRRDSKGQIVPDLEEFLAQLPHRRRYSDDDAGQIYGERCQILSYACINITDEQRNRLPKGQFATVEDRMLFEFATCLALGDAVSDRTSIPAAEEVERLSGNQIKVWQCWRAMALKESAVFLATEDISFNKNSLPHNIENDYLPLYLFTLFQKFRLFVFSNRLMGKGAYIKRNLKEVRELMERFIRFRNLYWFNELTRKPLGGQLYRKFQQGLEVPLLYELVASEVREIQEYYEGRNSRRTNRLLNVLTFVFVPLGTIVSFFGLELIPVSWLSFAIACTGAAIVSLILWLWWQRQK